MKTVTIIGVGALGSHLVQFIRNHAHIEIIDFDRVEAKNVLSQFHPRTSVGKAKVESIKQTMNFLFSKRIDVNPHKLTDLNVDKLIGGADIVADCLDNGASRRVVQEYVRRHNIPCVHGGVAPNGSFGRVIWDEGFVIDDETGMGAATCEAGEHLPFLGLVGCYLARSVQEFLTTGKKMGFSISPTTVVAV